MENSPVRQALINRMMAILQEDTPWVWGFHPKDYSLHHAWLKNRKPSKVGNNTLKYQRVDAPLRQSLRDRWNPPVIWPLGLLAALLVLVALPAILSHRRRESATAQR